MSNTLKINLNEEVTQELKAIPDKKYKDFALLQLEKVILDVSVSDNTDASYQYHQMPVPRLIFNFVQYHSEDPSVRRVVNYVAKAVVSIKKDQTPQKDGVMANIYMEQYKHIRHIFDAFKDVPGVADITKLKLPALDMDASAEVHLKQAEKWYKAFYDLFHDKDGNGIYVDSKGKHYDLLTKLIINGKETSVSIPGYVGTGFIEMFGGFDAKGNFKTKLEIKPTEKLVYEKPVGGGEPGVTNPGGAAVDLNNI